MADSDNIEVRGRGTCRGIDRGRGKGRGRSTTTLPQTSTGQPTQPFIGQPTQPITPQTPISPQLHQSTPNPHLSSTGSPHVCSALSPSQPPADAASGDGSHIATTSSMQIGSVVNDGHMWICLGPQNMFDPPILPTREIIRIIKSKFEDCWENYREVNKNKQDLADLWYGELKV